MCVCVCLVGHWPENRHKSEWELIFIINSSSHMCVERPKSHRSMEEHQSLHLSLFYCRAHLSRSHKDSSERFINGDMDEFVMSTKQRQRVDGLMIISSEEIPRSLWGDLIIAIFD